MPAVLDSKPTDCLEFFIAITAAIKNVLSPISETNIIPQDFKNPVARPPAKKVVMLLPLQAGSAKLLILNAHMQVAACGLCPNSPLVPAVCCVTRLCAVKQDGVPLETRISRRILMSVVYSVVNAGGGQVVLANSCDAAETWELLITDYLMRSNDRKSKILRW